MQPLSTFIKDRKPKRTSTSERGELLQEFLRMIEPDWDAKKYGKQTIPRLARKLQGVPTKDFYYIKRVCEDSKSYAKTFFWLINPKKHEA